MNGSITLSEFVELFRGIPELIVVDVSDADDFDALDDKYDEEKYLDDMVEYAQRNDILLFSLTNKGNFKCSGYLLPKYAKADVIIAFIPNKGWSWMVGIEPKEIKEDKNVKRNTSNGRVGQR